MGKKYDEREKKRREKKEKKGAKGEKINMRKNEDKILYFNGTKDVFSFFLLPFADQGND